MLQQHFSDKHTVVAVTSDWPTSDEHAWFDTIVFMYYTSVLRVNDEKAISNKQQ